MTSFEEARARVRPPDHDAEDAAWAHHQCLAKAPGTLGELEGLGVLLAGMAGQCPPPIPDPVTVAVFAADHGVAKEMIPAPHELATPTMVANVLAGGAAVNVLASQVGADVVVVDVGVAADLPDVPGLVSRRIAPGTRNLRVEDAMTLDEAEAALDAGAQVATALVEVGARCLVTGAVGVANTVAASALVAKICRTNAVAVSGRGSGGNDRVVARTIEVIADALERTSNTTDPLAVLAALGGYEIAALAGFVVGGAAARVPVVIDGLVAQAALLVARELAPESWDYAVPAHRVPEPAGEIALVHLGLEPVVDAGLRVADGAGALLAVPLLQASVRLLNEMATAEEARVSEQSLG